MAYIFLFPSAHQAEILEKLVQLHHKDIIIVKSENHTQQSDEILIFSEHQFVEWRKNRLNDIWFCCNERAVYFASLHRQFINNLNFELICLDMLTKADMGNVLGKAGVPVLLKKSLKIFDEVEIFPIIVKPNFGFASALVKRITSQQELEKYTREYINFRNCSLIKSYQKDYFYNYDYKLLEEIMFEPDVSEGIFLSIPFIASPDGLIASFPVVGRKKIRTSESHFVWTEFQAPDHLPSEVRERVDRILDRLCKSFACSTSVFHAEIILDPKDSTPWVLEFSPRITGGNIPRLIYYSYGIDLDTYALELALGLNINPVPNYNTRDAIIISRKDEEMVPDNYGTVLESSYKTIDGIRYTQEIRHLL